jgi:2-keto-4-pentenoate hydratase/2-oxohepta-3-ene-1,7-dioic acid hydratase in catechol pathway
MRIIRFLDRDGRVHLGEEHGDGTATVLVDPQGVMGGRAQSAFRERFRGRVALVADDDENMRELMATVLTRVGCQCTVCTDGAEAIHALEHQPIDLVVSDIVMPHHDGYEIFAAAKRENSDIPVVLVTGFGYDPTHSLVRASKEGLTAVLYKPFTPHELLEEVDRAMRGAAGTPASTLARLDERLEIAKLLAPVAPPNVVCVGRNYGDAPDAGPPDELEVFMKPSTAVQAPGEPIRLPAAATDPLVDVEGELAVVIGARAQSVAPEHALEHVLGYTAANDVTARHWQRPAGPPVWMRGKGFDTFCPMGPAIVTPDEIGDPDALEVRTVVNGRTVRSGSTAGMIRPVATVVSELSRHITLEPGTVILTGAPPALEPPDEAARLADGDEVAVEIDAIGRLVNRVEAAVGAG